MCAGRGGATPAFFWAGGAARSRPPRHVDGGKTTGTPTGEAPPSSRQVVRPFTPLYTTTELHFNSGWFQATFLFSHQPPLARLPTPGWHGERGSPARERARPPSDGFWSAPPASATLSSGVHLPSALASHPPRGPPRQQNVCPVLEAPTASSEARTGRCGCFLSCASGGAGRVWSPRRLRLRLHAPPPATPPTPAQKSKKRATAAPATGRVCLACVLACLFGAGRGGVRMAESRQQLGVRTGDDIGARLPARASASRPNPSPLPSSRRRRPHPFDVHFGGGGRPV